MDLIPEKAYFAPQDHEQQSRFQQDHPPVDKHVSKVLLFQECYLTRHHYFLRILNYCCFLLRKFHRCQMFQNLVHTLSRCQSLLKNLLVNLRESP